MSTSSSTVDSIPAVVLNPAKQTNTVAVSPTPSRNASNPRYRTGPITDADLIALPPQRTMALSMYRDRHRPSIAPDPLGKMNDENMRRVLPRTWIALARRQEALQRTTRNTEDKSTTGNPTTPEDSETGITKAQLTDGSSFPV